MISTDSKETPQAHYSLTAMLAPVLFLTVIFFVNFTSRVVISPLLPAMELDLRISHAAASSLYMFMNLGFLAGLLGSGFLVARLPHRMVIIFSTLGVGCALLAMLFIHSLESVRLLFLILGMAAGLYLPSGVAAITALISPNHWGKALAFHEMAPVLAYVLSPLLAEAFLGWVSWQGVFGIIGLLSVVAGILFARFGRGGAFTGQAPNLEKTRQICLSPSLWIIIFLMSLAVGSGMGVYNVMPLYLINEHGLERSLANILLALCRVSGLLLVNLAGWASDRLGVKRAIGVVLALGGLLTLGLGLAPTSVVLVVLFLQPLTSTCLFPPMMKAVAELYPAQYRNLVVALAVAVAVFLGGGVMPAGIGWLAEMSSFGVGIAISGGLMLAGLFLLPRLNIPQAAPNGQAGRTRG